MSITTEQILKDSLTAIDNGLWVCDTLAEVNKDGKVMGCALGLVGINAGLGTIVTSENGQVDYCMTYPEEAEDGDGDEWPVEALDAVFALAKTTEDDILVSNITDASYLVTKYNDGGYLSDGTALPTLTADGAKAWFTRALESVQA